MAQLETTHLFHGNINNVFRALGQFERYPEFIPGVMSTQILPPNATSKAKCQVKTEVNIVKTFYYTIEIFEESPNKIWWTLIDSNLMKHNSGSWTLKDDGETKTSAVYKLDVAFRGLVPSMITDQIAKANLPQMFAGFQKMIDTIK